MSAYQAKAIYGAASSELSELRANSVSDFKGFTIAINHWDAT